MVVHRVAALYAVIGFILGVYAGSRVRVLYDCTGSRVCLLCDCVKPQSTAADRLRVLSEIYELDDVRTAAGGEGKPLEKPHTSTREDFVRRNATNASVISTKENVTGLQLLQQDAMLLARQFEREVRVLCWIMTSPATLEKRARQVRDTWGKRCDVLLFASDSLNPTFPTINISVTHGREHLAMKTTKTFDYIYAQHRDDADWFLKADDDTYVVMENLRHMLAPYDPREALSFGHAFVTTAQFFSGGAGYVISREALNRWAFRPPGRCPEDGGEEDFVMAECLTSLGVTAGDSRDSRGRQRFIPSRIIEQLTDSIPRWRRVHNKYKHDKEAISASDYPVSFHYVTGKEMHEIEYFMYRAHTYGIVGGLESVNPTSGETAVNDVIATKSRRRKRRR